MSRAYENCDARAYRNRAYSLLLPCHRRRILYFLIPLKMSKGSLPPQQLLDDYQFEFVFLLSFNHP